MKLIKLYMKYPAYGYLQIGGFLSSLGSWASFLAMLILLDNLTNNGMELGALWAISGIIPIVLGYFYGVWIDRLDVKKLIRNMELVALVGYLLFVLIFFVDKEFGVFIFLIARFVLLTAGNIYSTCLNTVIPEIVAKEDLNIANGYSFTIGNIIRLIGASAGGILISFVELHIVWVINVFICVIVYVLALLSQRYYKTTRLEVKEKSFIKEMKEGINLTKENLWVKSVILISLVSGIIIGSFNIVLQQFTANVYKDPPYVLTLLYVAHGLASVIASYVILYKNTLLDTRSKYAVIYMMYAASWISFGFTTNYYFGIFFLILCSIFSALHAPYQRITMQNEVPFQVRGRVFAMWATTHSLAIQIGALITGFIIDLMGIQYVPFVTGIIAVIVASYVFILASRRDNKILYNKV